MFSEIGRFLSTQGFANYFALILLIILYDEKSIYRIRKKKLRRLLSFTICGYFVLFTINIVRIVIKYSG